MAEKKLKIGYDAEDMREALRKRHPSHEPGVMGVGQWTTLTEWCNIDLLALDAWRTGRVVGYEIKVSRSDMRHELLRPEKRAAAVAMCTEFYFAVPAGMVKPEELEFEEPAWEPGDFERQKCPGIPAFGPPKYAHRFNDTPRFGGECLKHRGGHRRRYAWVNPKMPKGSLVEVPIPYTLPDYVEPSYGNNQLDVLHDELGTQFEPCPRCKGKGYVDVSRVEREAPTLWVPRDVGLVAVGGNGCSVIRPAPKRKVTEPIIPWPMTGSRPNSDDPREQELASRLERQAIANFARWISVRPDPRHHRRRSDTY